jgi:hypothetical protein
MRPAVDTAQLSFVATAAVGSVAAVSPALTAWANRAHDRKMVRAQRRYDQRHQTYVDLSVFLERQ